MKFRFALVSCALGLIATVELIGICQTSSAAPVGRTLAVKEAWSLFGGENGMCSTGMDRCYAWPDNCSNYDGTVCDQDIYYEAGAHTITCRSSSNYFDYCYEIGDQVTCMLYGPCRTRYVGGMPDTCYFDPFLDVLTPDSVTAPENGTTAVECQ